MIHMQKKKKTDLHNDNTRSKSNIQKDDNKQMQQLTEQNQTFDKTRQKINRTYITAYKTNSDTCTKGQRTNTTARRITFDS